MDEFKKLEKQTKKLRDTLSSMKGSTFSYYEQELIHRVFKSVIIQLKSAADKQTAQDILDKTEWLDE